MKKISKILSNFVLVVSLLVVSTYTFPISADGELVEGVDYDVIEIVIPVEEMAGYEESSVGNNSELQTYAGAGWSIRNKRAGGILGKPTGPTVEGAPGGTISMNHITEVTYSVTLSAGIKVGDVNAAISGGITTSKSVSLGYSYLIPHNANGKRVRSAKITAYAEARIHNYDIYYLEAKYTSGTAYKFQNLKYVVTLYYY